MNWWGKIVGGTFGFMIGGPLGAMLGAVLGHNFDKGLDGSVRLGEYDSGGQERVQTAFFAATFSVMGHICKADGKVTDDEIAMARQVMAQMDLSAQQKEAAIALFNEGKKSGFNLDAILAQLRMEIGYQPNLQRMFIEIQLYAAFADGVLHPMERNLLLKVCGAFGLSQRDFEVLAAAIGGEVHHRQSQRPTRPDIFSLEDAYAVLSLKSSATDAEVKRAYRRLMSQHHPDKLVSKGLPEEMMKIAEQRTREIRQAYERLKEARGF